MGSASNRAIHNATCIIRLITRLIFVWFLKEKNLVPDALFDEDDMMAMLANLDPQESTYYKAILQNLFFATLNQEMNYTPLIRGAGGLLLLKQITPLIKGTEGGSRKFRGEGRQHYNITSLYRYKRYFRNPECRAPSI